MLFHTADKHLAKLGFMKVLDREGFPGTMHQAQYKRYNARGDYTHVVDIKRCRDRHLIVESYIYCPSQPHLHRITAGLSAAELKWFRRKLKELHDDWLANHHHSD